MELISREKLKETIEPMVGMFDDEGDFYWSRESILRVIDNLPTVEERKWIPVSKRLPKEERKAYLITTDTGYMCSCRWTDDVCGFGIHSEWGWHRIDKPKYSKVVAWMDLEPYKGE